MTRHIDAKKLAVFPIGSCDTIKKFNTFLNNATNIPETGPNANVATSTGISLKSIVKYGGKNGNGNFKNIKIKLIAMSILTVSKRFVLLSLDI